MRRVRTIATIVGIDRAGAAFTGIDSVVTPAQRDGVISTTECGRIIGNRIIARTADDGVIAQIPTQSQIGRAQYPREIQGVVAITGVVALDIGKAVGADCRAGGGGNHIGAGAGLRTDNLDIADNRSIGTMIIDCIITRTTIEAVILGIGRAEVSQIGTGAADIGICPCT